MPGLRRSKAEKIHPEADGSSGLEFSRVFKTVVYGPGLRIVLVRFLIMLVFKGMRSGRRIFQGLEEARRRNSHEMRGVSGRRYFVEITRHTPFFCSNRLELFPWSNRLLRIAIIVNSGGLNEVR